jgi:protocatechuate 3,4-dioxygenase beta subunit
VGSWSYFQDFADTLPADGDYILVVSNNPYDSASTYTFTAYQNTTSSGSLTLGVVTSGTLANPGDQATYTFSGTAGQRLFLNGQGADSDIRVNITSSSGTTVVSNQQLAYDFGPFTLTQAGTYTVTVFGSGRASGKFSFQLSDLSGASPLTFGTPSSLTLADQYAAGTFIFSGTAGQRLYLAASSGSLYDATWALYGPNNQQVGSSYYFQDIAATLPASGTYVLAIEATSNNTSSNTFSFTAYQNTTSSGSLTLGVVTSGTLANPGDQATYTFSGTAGQQFYYHGLSADSGLAAQLLGPYGNSVFSTSAESDSGPFTLRISGSYLLILSGNGRSTGSFRFQLIDQTDQPALQVNTTEADLTLTLSAPATQQVLVGYTTVDGTATVAGGDYRLKRGVVLFASGQATAKIATQAINKVIAQPEQYQVTLSNPLGATIAAGQGTGTITLKPAGIGSISGMVFTDLTGNGVFDTGDSAQADVSVDLLGPTGTVVGSAKSDASGNYAITGISQGTYTVEEVLPPGYVQTLPGSPGTYSVTLSSGESVSGINFGDFKTVALQGHVYLDANADGSQDNGEAGTSSFSVDLLDNTGKQIATMTTDSNGLYSFPAIGPGNYTIAAALPPGYIQTSTPSSFSVTPSSGVDSVGHDFGVLQTGLLTGTVFTDLNGNGAMDPGETGLPGMTVQLKDGTNQVVNSERTDAAGGYSFTVDKPGTYTVTEVLPNGYVASIPSSGSYTKTVSTGQTISNLNFGDFQTVTLGGEVFADADGNGALNGGEGGLQGWAVQLLDGSGQQIRFAATDAQGAFSFSGIGPGTYTVKTAAQTGYISTSPASRTIMTASGQDQTAIDFGEFVPVTLSGEVYLDANGNGSVNGTEAGISGVTVTLVTGGGTTVSTQTTGVGGT